MGQFTPTKSQQQALTADKSDILISASAGSGKTTILVDRILKKLLVGQEIDHLLIVTFTDAAAQEMKQRLTKRIQEEVVNLTKPQLKQHLYHQLALIPSAYISTLHAFCLRIIRKFYYLIDLDPTFRLLSDENERYLLKERAWTKMRNSYYQNNDLDFLKLEDNFVSGNDDTAMADLIFRLTDFALTTPNPQNWIEALPQNYEVSDDITQTKFYQETLQATLINDLTYLILQLQKVNSYIGSYEELSGYQKSCQDLSQMLVNLKAQLPNLLWDDLRRQILALPTIKGRAKAHTDSEIMEPFNNWKKNINQQLQDFKYKLFALDNQQWQKILKLSGQLIKKLVEVAMNFMHQFRIEKKVQHSLDFNDLEHYAMQILKTEKDQQLVAKNYYQQQFNEILLDEYQDTNPLQEALIQQIKQKNPGNLFMVGDVKQSIYGFRQAAPQLFVHKYQQMQKNPQVGQLINLAENFRSSVNVIDTVNSIFIKIMDHQLGDLDYTRSTWLVNGTKFPDDLDTSTELILNTKKDSSKDTNNEQQEIKLIIARIQEMIAQDYQVFDRKTGQTRSLQYSDIAILTRVKSLNNDLVELFNQAHLPIIVSDAANYFQTTEVQVMVSMLKIIDNPRQDIPLVAVLRSMIGGLNENELAYLRINSRTGEYYQALINYLDDSEYNQKNKFAQNLTIKVQSFMQKLNNFREQAAKISIAELIWEIYLQTGFLSYVQGMPNGRQRAANLHALYQRAEQFEQMEFKGLFQFIRFIEHIQNNKKDLAQPIEHTQKSNEISVMTIHASKGLEFPIVFLLNIDHHFNNEDSRKKYLLNAQDGIGIKYLDPHTHIVYETLPMYTLKIAQKNKNLSEEIRLLYVALTRAQQKLILIGSTKNSLEQEWENWQLEETQTSTSGVIDIAIRSKFNSFQNMIQYVFKAEGEWCNGQIRSRSSSPFQFVIFDNDYFNLQNPTKNLQSDSHSQSNNTQKVSPLFQKTVQQILKFQYRYPEATKTTAYQSVSEIKHLFANPDDQNLPTLKWQPQLNGNRYILDDFVQPNFLTADKITVSAAEVGSATHLLLQKINLERQPQKQDFIILARQLVQQKLLSLAVAEQINYQSLAQLFQSALGQEILQYHNNLKREWSFSMLLPAQRLFKKADSNNDDQILIHGIIDGLFSNQNNQITIFDYKTDQINIQDSSGPHSLQHVLKEYSGQLNLYQQAVEQISSQKVQHKYLCLLSINQVIEVE